MSTTLFANTFSNKEIKDLVGEIQKPKLAFGGVSLGYTDPGLCTGGIQSCTSSNCYTCGNSCS